MVCFYIREMQLQWSPQYLKVKDTEHDQWSNQKLLHQLHHAKNQFNSLIYS